MFGKLFGFGNKNQRPLVENPPQHNASKETVATNSVTEMMNQAPEEVAGNAGRANGNGNVGRANGNVGRGNGNGNAGRANGNVGRGNGNGNAGRANSNAGRANGNGNAGRANSNGNAGRANSNGNVGRGNGNAGRANSNAGRANGNGNAGRANGNGNVGRANGNAGRVGASVEIESSEDNTGFAQEPLVVPRNMEMNVLPNKEKFHFFIGSILKKEDVGPLIQIRKGLERNPVLKNKRWNPYHTRYIYLGYVDKRVAEMMMEKLFHPLCQAIADKYAPFRCTYDKVVFRGKQRKNKIVSIQYHDEANKIRQSIIPYLRQEGLRQLYSVDASPGAVEAPHVDLMYFHLDEGVRASNVYTKISQEVPSEGFQIDNLCLIKGDPFRGGGSGVPSKYDRLIIECVSKYQYSLQGSS